MKNKNKKNDGNIKLMKKNARRIRPQSAQVGSVCCHSNPTGETIFRKLIIFSYIGQQEFLLFKGK